MLCTKVSGKLVYSAKQLAFVELCWNERDQKGLKKLSTDGEEIELSIEKRLEDRDIIFEDKERLIAIRLLPCKVMAVRVNTFGEVGRLCHLLGSFGLPFCLDDEWVRFPFESDDERLSARLKSSGFYGQVSEEIFDGYYSGPQE